jgi:hypothetical protein
MPCRGLGIEIDAIGGDSVAISSDSFSTRAVDLALFARALGGGPELPSRSLTKAILPLARNRGEFVCVDVTRIAVCACAGLIGINATLLIKLANARVAIDNRAMFLCFPIKPLS